MTIDARELNEVFLDCLFRDDEIVDRTPPANAVLVEGVVTNFGFHHDRLEQHRDEVKKWLLALPHHFRANEGGGWSFLNACVDEDGQQWGEHRNMEQLFALGMGLKLVACLLPREAWGALPGGMPYFEVSV